MRALYLFGTLPSTLGTDEQLVWRKSRQGPNDKYQQFLAKIAEDKFVANDPNHKEEFEEVTSKLTALLELQAELPSLCGTFLFHA